MNNGEKLIALESIITEFAKSQLAANEVPPGIAYLVMKSVYSNFQEFCIESTVMGMVVSPKAEEQKRGEEDAHTNA